MASNIGPGFMRVVTPEYDSTLPDGTVEVGKGVVEGVPEWTMSDTSVADMIVAPDGKSGKIQYNGTAGEFDLTVSADGDLGTGVSRVVLSEHFVMEAALGATGGRLGIGDQVPIA